MRKIAKKLEEFLLPTLCLLCGVQRVNERQNFCLACFRKARFIAKPHCAITGVPFAFEWEAGTISRRARLAPPVYDHARAALRYESDFARPLILRLKYGDHPELARYVAPWLTRAGEDILSACDYIVPVPIHWLRLLERRFNQAAELARAVSRLTNRPYSADLIKRTKATPPQIGLGRKARRRNMHRAFAVPQSHRNQVEGKHLVLVDDVFTSGATMESCANTLRKAGAARVDILVLARVVHEIETLV